MQTDDGKTVKLVPRYQQYRAVGKAIDRLVHGKTKRQDGEEDRRGGIVRQTQGSGKSLTMSFLVRKMRTVPGLRKTKVVVVTDRTQLQRQLSQTVMLAGEKVDTAKKIAQARRLLSQHSPGIVFVMVQKQQDDTRPKPADDEIIEGRVAPFPELNTDESIVVLVDEAHRSRWARRRRPSTSSGRTHTSTCTGSPTPSADVMEAEELIAAKAKSMLRHYVETVLPNGFKAQLAAHSRRATVRYRAALIAARDDLVARIESLPEATRNADPATLNPRTAYLVRAAAHLDLLKAIDFVPVISAGTANDERVYERWTDPDRQAAVIGEFTTNDLHSERRQAWPERRCHRELRSAAGRRPATRPVRDRTESDPGHR